MSTEDRNPNTPLDMACHVTERLGIRDVEILVEFLTEWVQENREMERLGLVDLS